MVTPYEDLLRIQQDALNSLNRLTAVQLAHATVLNELRKSQKQHKANHHMPPVGLLRRIFRFFV